MGFNGNNRFKLLRRLGSGGMGVVYEALDQQRNARIALKTVHAVDGYLIYRLKQEFRGLRDLVHPNLISLDELFEENGDWFFTMEIVDGEDLLAYFSQLAIGSGRHDPVTAAQFRANDAGRDMTARDDGKVGHASDEARAAHWVDFAGVREIFRQVAEGLIAIHDGGKIHRDIKPSNIMVTHDRRVVILDFGLVTEQWDAGRSGHGEVVGTILYMAPEQAAGGRVGPAADWYSVGVMLYEIIAGVQPFEGSFASIHIAKQCSEPRDPRLVNPSCPDDLAVLCQEMLRIDPERRPHGRDVLRRLGVGERRGSTPPWSSQLASARSRFVGREPELRDLATAFHDVEAGASIVTFLHGESGIGKSTLLQYFVSTVQARRGKKVILSGQCREHELVPFNAMDGIIDALSRFVCRLPEVDAAELVPQNAGVLPAVFPVLGRIAAIARAPRTSAATDPFHQRTRVFAALREMLVRLTERYTLICVIDDMQWADSDSLQLLEELLRPPGQPRLLLLAGVRTTTESATLPRLPGETRQLHLERFNGDESATLARTLLAQIAPDQKSQARRIIDESRGHPLFIAELVQYAATDRGATIEPLRLDEAIWARVSQLDEAARRILMILALAPAPLPEATVHAAANLERATFQKSVALLRVNNFVRSANHTQAYLEVYHDRIRQALVAHCPDDQRIALNEQIAIAIEHASAVFSPEALIHHLEGARQLERAAHCALEGAERAHTGLAFEQASRLYQAALRLASWSDGERREILIKQGAALASSGRGADAADSYARAAEGAEPITRLTCRIQQADQLVQSGRLESGAELLFSLFREHHHEVPRSRVEIALRVAWYRARLALRGLRWTDRPRDSVEPMSLALLSLYKAASRGLILIDPLLAAYFVIRGLHLSLDTGDRDFIMYFLLLEAGFRGSDDVKKHRPFLARAKHVLASYSDPAFQLSYRLSAGSRAYLAVDRSFKEAVEMLDRSDEVLAQSANAAWEQSTGRFFLIYSLLKMGDFPRLRSYSERFMREAEQRGNVFMRTTISRLRIILHLIDDDPGKAREVLLRNSLISQSQGYHSQYLDQPGLRWLELSASTETALYERGPLDAEVFFQRWNAVRRSVLRHVLAYRCDTHWLAGRVALFDHGKRTAAIVRRCADNLLSYDTYFSRTLAHMLRATHAVQQGDAERAVAAFREVVTLGEIAGTQLIVAVARRRLGQLLGGDSGHDLAATAERWMAEAGVVNFDRVSDLISPCKV